MVLRADFGGLTRAQLAFPELALGQFSRARDLAERALEILLASEGVFARCFGLYHAAAWAACARAPERAGELGGQLVALAGVHGLEMWERLGREVVGWSRFELGDAEAAKVEIGRRLSDGNVSGSGLLGALCRSVGAEALAALGDPSAIAVAEEAERRARRSGVLFGLAEIQRRRGRVLRLMAPNARPGAEQAFRAALATAHAQGARLWELRAACELGRLLADEARAAEGRNILAGVLRDIPGDDASPDLAEARALLDG
jgi:hypothetical protein